MLHAFLRTIATFVGGYLIFLAAVLLFTLIDGHRVTYVEVWFAALGILLIYFIATVLTVPVVKILYSKISALSAFLIGSLEAACILSGLAWWSLPTTQFANHFLNWFSWATVIVAGLTAVFLAWGYRMLDVRPSAKKS